MEGYSPPRASPVSGAAMIGRACARRTRESIGSESSRDRSSTLRQRVVCSRQGEACCGRQTKLAAISTIRRGPEAAGDVRRTMADVSRIKAELGWQPSVALDDGLHAELEWDSGRVGAR